MEYRLEVDGDSFCDPHNPLRAPGAFGDKSVGRVPRLRAAAWLAAPDPGPAAPLAERAGLWSPPDTDPRRPLPLLVAHDGGEYERLSGLTRLIAHAIATGRIPPCRVALLDPATATRPTPPRRATPRCSPPASPARPATAHAGLGASLGALALLHARWLHPGAFGALMLQSGSFFRQRWDRQESGFPRFRRISRFVGQVLNAGPAATPIPITLTCGAPEENLANNRAVADRAAPPGPRRDAARQPRRAQLRRLARHARPAPRGAARARLGIESRPMTRTHLIGLLLGTEEDWSGAFETMMARLGPRSSTAASATSSPPSASRSSRSTCACGRATRSSSTASRTGTTCRASGSRRSR